MMQHDAGDSLGRILRAAKSKSDLHRAIDALGDGATLILVANACCCGVDGHASDTGEVVYHASFGEPSLPEALGLLRLAEHAMIDQARNAS